MGMTNTARQPIGGYVVDGLFWLMAAIAPVAGIWHLLNGDIVNAGLAVLAGIGLYLMAKVNTGTNEDVWEFRSYLRRNHPWAYRVGVGTRWGGIGIVMAALGADIMLLQSGQITTEIITAIGVLLVLSMISVAISTGLDAFVYRNK
jgi:hypothetical protein